MSAFQNAQTIDGFTMKLWRGERMCLIGFDVESPPADLVGFAIECRFPGTDAFKPLLNRIAFAYDEPTHSAVDGQLVLDPEGRKNGDHLILIEDQRIAVVYAIQALLIFDHLHFRSVMQKTFTSADETQGRQPPPLVLKNPRRSRASPPGSRRTTSQARRNRATGSCSLTKGANCRKAPGRPHALLAPVRVRPRRSCSRSRQTHGK